MGVVASGLLDVRGLIGASYINKAAFFPAPARHLRLAKLPCARDNCIGRSRY